MTISPFTPISSIGPLTNITPFSHRDNATFLRILKEIVNYINLTLRPEMDSELARILSEFNAKVDEFNEHVSTTKAEWLAMYQQFKADIEAAIAANEVAFDARMDAAEADIAAAKADWFSRWETFTNNVEMELAALSDAAMGGLIENPASETSKALAKFYDRSGIIDLRNHVSLEAAIEFANGKPIYIPGTVDLGATGLIYTGTKPVNLVGRPGISKITGTGTYILQLTGISAEAVNITGISFEGNATSASAAAARLCALSVENRTGNVTVDDCRFSGWVNMAGLRIQGGSGIVVSNCRFTNGFDTEPIKSTLGAIHITGTNTNRIRVKDNRLTGPATNPWSVGIMLVGYESMGFMVQDAIVTGNHVSGLIRSGIGITHEGSGPVYNSGTLIVSENIVRNCKEQGIKIKIAKRVHVHNNFVSDCNTLPELLGQLDGGINVQSTSEGSVIGNTIINDGTDGIRWDVKHIETADPYGGEIGRADHVISGNTIYNPVQSGIRVGLAATDLSITGNSIVKAGGHGIRIDPNSTDSDLQINRITVSGNIIRKSGANGIYCINSDSITIVGNTVSRSGNFGIAVDSGNNFVINSNVVEDSGQTGSQTIGIRVGATAIDTVIMGNYSGNKETTTQTYGISYAAPAISMGNHLTNNVTGRTSGSAGNAQYQFAGSAVTTARDITGNRADAGLALTRLLNELATIGLITNSTTA